MKIVFKIRMDNERGGDVLRRRLSTGQAIIAEQANREGSHLPGFDCWTYISYSVYWNKIPRYTRFQVLRAVVMNTALLGNIPTCNWYVVTRVSEKIITSIVKADIKFLQNGDDYTNFKGGLFQKNAILINQTKYIQKPCYVSASSIQSI